MENELDEVILIRKFEHKDGKQVLLLIGKPIESKNGSDYECPFKYVGLGNERVRWTSGIDGLQSLVLCIQRASALFEQQEDVKQGTVTWLGAGTLGI